MFTMTDDAGAHLADLLECRGASEDTAMRIAAGPGGITLMVDAAQPGDRRFQHRERVVLVVGERIYRALAGRVLVCMESDGARHLVLTRAASG